MYPTSSSETVTAKRGASAAALEEPERGDGREGPTFLSGEPLLALHWGGTGFSFGSVQLGLRFIAQSPVRLR